MRNRLLHWLIDNYLLAFGLGTGLAVGVSVPFIPVAQLGYYYLLVAAWCGYCGFSLKEFSVEPLKDARATFRFFVWGIIGYVPFCLITIVIDPTNNPNFLEALLTTPKAMAAGVMIGMTVKIQIMRRSAPE